MLACKRNDLELDQVPGNFIRLVTNPSIISGQAVDRPPVCHHYKAFLELSVKMKMMDSKADDTII